MWIYHGIYCIYPMLSADSRFWFVNNPEISRRISRLTSSAWDIETKEHHWWCHNGDSDCHPLYLPLWYDRVTLCLYCDIGQINVIAGILKLWKRFRMSQILFEHGINSLPLACFRGYQNLSTLNHRNTTLGIRPRVVLRCFERINSRIHISKQGVTNSVIWVANHVSYLFENYVLYIYKSIQSLIMLLYFQCQIRSWHILHQIRPHNWRLTIDSFNDGKDFLNIISSLC